MNRSATALASPPLEPESIGVYVHFPWCLQKCPYCDFLSVPIERPAIPHAKYADAVIAELQTRRVGLDDAPLRSVFFGGGTPSLWDTAELGRVLEHIRGCFPNVQGEVEVTAECNPSSFDPRVADGLRRAGVNRISLGVQGLESERLAFLGRLHDGAGALSALRLALETGFTRVSGDLIFGVAGQMPESAAEEARTLARLGLTHLSAYALTIEPGTQFGERARRGRLPLLAEALVADAFSAVEAALEAEGFAHYEISNYARDDARSLHNLGYWRGEPYLGLGAGAWGTLRRGSSRFRYRNTPSIERYLTLPVGLELSALESVGPWIAAVETLSAETALAERVMLGLRLAEGIDIALAERATGAPFFTAERRRALEKWERRGALTLSEGRLRLGKRHWLLADGIISELM